MSDNDLTPNAGEMLLGTFTAPTDLTELFGVVGSKDHPGFYFLAHVDGGGILSETPRPVRADFVPAVLRYFTRFPERLDGIAWMHRPAADWPFPSTETVKVANFGYLPKKKPGVVP